MSVHVHEHESMTEALRGASERSGWLGHVAVTVTMDGGDDVHVDHSGYRGEELLVLIGMLEAAKDALVRKVRD